MTAKPAVLVEYYCTDESTLVFGARAEWNQPEVREISIPLTELRNQVRHLFQEESADAHSSRSASRNSKIRHLDEVAFQQAFGQLIEPVREWSAEGEIVWFVPHDALHYVPLHALTVDGRYLIERNPVVYSPSASVMQYCRRKHKGRPQRALVLGRSPTDMADAAAEAQNVARLFHTTPYLQDAATKRLVKEKLETEREQIDILHFACRGVFDDKEPLLSRILLAGDGSEHPDLTAQDFFALQMHAELVVLSACVTGVNDRRPGDELIGLTRAVIYAGTPSVIVSLWEVPDASTRLLMQAFYEEWLTPHDQPITKAEALQRAQIAILRLSTREAVRRIKYLDQLIAGPPPAGTEDPATPKEKRVEANAPDSPHNPSGHSADPAGNSRGFDGPYHRPYFWAPFILVGDWL